MSQKTATYHILSFASADSDVRVHSGMSRGPCPVFVSVLRVGEATGRGLVEARPWGGACRAVAASADGGRLRVCVHGASYVPPGRLRSPHLAYRRDPRAGGHGASCGQTVERAARGSRFDSHLQRVASVELLGRGVSVRVRPCGWEQRHSRAGRWLWLSHGAWSSFSDSTWRSCSSSLTMPSRLTSGPQTPERHSVLPAAGDAGGAETVRSCPPRFQN